MPRQPGRGEAGAGLEKLNGSAERSDCGQRDDEGYDTSDDPAHESGDCFFHCGISSFHIGTPLTILITHPLRHSFATRCNDGHDSDREDGKEFPSVFEFEL